VVWYSKFLFTVHL